ncbi:TK/RTKC protein kinase [Salpingoeca rosetta]|uniref:non-specific protein-tyrosine kinase n=1 Tax=Salpingoeca rosetta (strain ATCC 50818 / BSB-021) TaxID=946362 RepID=F2UPS4_SALR5|nr:TK/RTKC protein kinase [Salpingoeca rosetta]EGD79629.1 TK/RTKC protein kinase [Salpingoeca rosetta]|eukprot:XP_004988857.1 TK/RTKC protein kinase [Salpingoeca rosetta]
MPTNNVTPTHLLLDMIARTTTASTQTDTEASFLLDALAKQRAIIITTSTRTSSSSSSGDAVLCCVLRQRSQRTTMASTCAGKSDRAAVTALAAAVCLISMLHVPGATANATATHWTPPQDDWTITVFSDVDCSESAMTHVRYTAVSGCSSITDYTNARCDCNDRFVRERANADCSNSGTENGPLSGTSTCQSSTAMNKMFQTYCPASLPEWADVLGDGSTVTPDLVVALFGDNACSNASFIAYDVVKEGTCISYDSSQYSATLLQYPQVQLNDCNNASVGTTVWERQCFNLSNGLFGAICSDCFGDLAYNPSSATQHCTDGSPSTTSVLSTTTAQCALGFVQSPGTSASGRACESDAYACVDGKIEPFSALCTCSDTNCVLCYDSASGAYDNLGVTMIGYDEPDNEYLMCEENVADVDACVTLCASMSNCTSFSYEETAAICCFFAGGVVEFKDEMDSGDSIIYFAMDGCHECDFNYYLKDMACHVVNFPPLVASYDPQEFIFSINDQGSFPRVLTNLFIYPGVYADSTVEVDVSVAEEYSDIVNITGSDVMLLAPFNATGVYNVTITAQDNRNECVYDDDGSRYDGPCTTDYVIQIVVMDIVCAEDQLLIATNDDHADTDLTFPTAFPLPQSQFNVTSSKEDLMSFPLGVTTVNFTGESELWGVINSCGTTVSVFRGVEVEVDVLSATSGDNIMTIFVVTNLFGDVLSPLGGFNMTQDTNDVIISISASTGEPFLVSSQTNQYDLRLSFDLRFCPDGVSFPTSATLVDMDQSTDTSSASGMRAVWAEFRSDGDVPGVTLVTKQAVVDAESGCFRVSGESSPIRDQFLFDTIDIYFTFAEDAFVAGLLPVDMAPVSPGYVAFVADSGTSPLPPSLLLEPPVTLEDREAPKFTNCPSEPIVVYAGHGEATAVAMWDDIVVTDNIGAVLTPPDRGPGSAFSVVDSPHAIVYSATDGIFTTTCEFWVIVNVEEELAVSLSPRISTITKEEETFAGAALYAVTYSLLDDSPHNLTFTEDLLTKNTISVTFAEASRLAVVLQGTANATDVRLQVDMQWVTSQSFSQDILIDADDIKVTAVLTPATIDDTSSSSSSSPSSSPDGALTEELALEFSSLHREMVLGSSGGEITVVGEAPISGAVAFGSIILKLTYINDLETNLPSQMTEWTPQTATIGFRYLYDEDTTVAEDVYAVAFYDANPPVIFGCPTEAIRASNDPGKQHATVSFPKLTAEDDQAGFIVPTNPLYTNFTGTFEVQLPPALSGVRVVYTATDWYGNTATCAFDVRVVDSEPPQVVCHPDVVVWELSAGSDDVDLTMDDITGNYTDNVDFDGWVTVQEPRGGVSLGVGNYSFTTTVSDAYKNTNSCVTYIEVIDMTPPAILSCPTDQTGVADPDLDPNDPSLPIAGAASNTDTYVAINFTASIMQNIRFHNDDVARLEKDVPTLARYAAGRTPVTVTAYDAAGNPAVCSFDVVVADTTQQQPQAATALDSSALAGIGTGAGVVVMALAVVVFMLRRVSRKPQEWDDIFASMEAFSLQQEAQGGPVRPREIRRAQLKLNLELGKGAFGIVYKGLLKDIPGVPAYLVAVKSLHDNATGADKQELLEEAAVMAQFAHPNVVAMVGVVTVGDPLLVILEYMEHGSLKSYLENKDVPSELKIQFIADCCAGLAHIHAKGFIHRDVAARNVLISTEVTAKIADFGLTRESKEHEDYYRSRGGALPVRWTAPEALESRKFDESTDIWSMGIVMHEVYTRADTPYKGFTNQKVWVQVCAGYRLPRPPTCQQVVYESMLRCWAADPSQRPSFTELEQTFRKLQETNLAPAIGARPSHHADVVPNPYVDDPTNCPDNDTVAAYIDNERMATNPMYRGNRNVAAAAAAAHKAPPPQSSSSSSSSRPTASAPPRPPVAEEEPDAYVDMMNVAEVKLEACEIVQQHQETKQHQSAPTQQRVERIDEEKNEQEYMDLTGFIEVPLETVKEPTTTETKVVAVEGHTASSQRSAQASTPDQGSGRIAKEEDEEEGVPAEERTYLEPIAQLISM